MLLPSGFTVLRSNSEVVRARNQDANRGKCVSCWVIGRPGGWARGLHIGRATERRGVCRAVEELALVVCYKLV